jgi:hypothetical protein
MTTSLATRAALRAAFPDGVATVRSLGPHGVSERTAYKRCLDGGPWQSILPGVVLLFTGHPTRHQILRAALLLGGNEALITGVEACRLLGIRRGPAKREVGAMDEVHILVPHHRQVRSTGFAHVERTRRMPDPIRRNGLPLASLPRACLDAARRLGNRGDIAELFSDAVQRRLCTVTDLTTELASASRRGTAMPRSVLRDVSGGIRSAAELRALRLLERSGLPEPRRNVWIYDANGRFLGVADFWFDDVAMVWEIESTEWHLDPEQHDRDVERAADFAAGGAVYVASKPSKVIKDPADVLRMLSATYAQAKARPRPALCAESNRR